MSKTLFPALLVVLCFSLNDEYWLSKWAAMLGVAACLIGIRVGKETHWSLGLALTYSILAGLFSGHPTAPSTMTLLLLAWAALSLRAEDMPSLHLTLGTACLVASGHIVWQFARGLRGINLWGLFAQGSMTGCFIAFTTPFLSAPIARVISWFDWGCRWSGYLPDDPRFPYLVAAPLLVLPPLAIGLLLTSNHASMPVGVLFVCLIVLFRRWWLIGSLGAALSAIGLFLNPQFFDSSGRLNFYEVLIRWFFSHVDPVFGMGAGAYGFWVKEIQGYDKSEWLYWAHCDPLQLFFDQGAVGFSLWALAAGFALHRLWKAGQYSRFSSLSGWLACSCFQYPAHMSLHSFVGAVLVSTAYTDKRG